MIRLFRSRAARATAALVPIVVAVLMLFLLEHARRPKAVSQGPDGSAPARTNTRLLVLLVDSLAERDVAPRTMPRLSARLARSGLHGPVRACADAVTVPCVLALVRGHDWLSVFALGRNFGGRTRALDDSVLGALKARGRRLGYFGEPQLARTFEGLDRVVARTRPDAETLADALSNLKQGQLDLSFAHLLAVDDAGHVHGPRSERYARVLDDTDRLLEHALASLTPGDHALVLGDHGHALDGRHAAGLDTTTYAAYFGPRFARPSRHPMALTDHAALLARVFGERRTNEPAWVDAYLRGRPPSASEATVLPPLETDAHVPLGLALLVALSSLFVAIGAADFRALRSLRAVHVLALAVGMAAVAGFALAWPVLRGFSFTAPLGAGLLAALAAALLGVIVLRAYPVSGAPIWARALAGLGVFALPVVQLEGGPRPLVIGLALTLLFVPTGARTARWIGAALLASLAPVSLADEIPREFVVYTWLASQLGWTLPALLGAGAIASASMGAQRLQTLGTLAFGIGLSALLPLAPPRVGLVVCALSLPVALYALRRPRAFALAAALCPGALWIFCEGQPDELAPVIAVLAVSALAPRLVPGTAPSLRLTRAALLFLLLWLVYWTTMGTRIGGVDYDFYFRFLPEGATATREWPLQALLTAEKHLLPAALVLLLAQAGRAFDALDFELAAALARARLGVLLFLTAILAGARMVPSSWLLGEATQEAALFVLLLLTLGLVGASSPAASEPGHVTNDERRRKEDDAAAQ